MRSGACSRAEAKGGGAPTGMSATAAVAGKPIHTPSSLRGRRSKGVPKAFHGNRDCLADKESCVPTTWVRALVQAVPTPAADLLTGHAVSPVPDAPGVQERRKPLRRVMSHAAVAHGHPSPDTCENHSTKRLEGWSR